MSDENETHEDDKPKRARKPDTIKVTVVRDFWIHKKDIPNTPGAEEDGRVRAGNVIDVPVEQAMDGVESGAFTRYKA